ncbi:MAG: hypothetical protein PHS59_17630 [Paludibacter sp.]|nr:hypothetical protein [Paludibacter sp.]
MKNITTLVHHIKLNESGWWEKAVQNIIISSIGSEGNFPQTKKDILSKLIIELEQGIDIVRLEKQFEKLIIQNQVISRTENLWNLSDVVFEKFKEADKEQKDLEEEAKKRFIEITILHCKDINPLELWNDFKSKMLFPLVKDIGAKTYEFISGKKSINLIELESFQNFAKCYNGEKGEIENVVMQFMSFNDKATKSFLLKLLNEYFFLEATNLDESTVNEIYKFSKTQQNLKVFVDTNFLLTVLDLHDNPSNDATKALLDLLTEIENKVKIKFYILPNTIHEFQNLIFKFQDYISRLKPTIAYASAVEESTEFSGIIKKYFQRCNEVKRIIPPGEYFDPYLTNFSVCYRSKGIELFNQNVDKYSTDQRVIDDLLVQTEYRLERKIDKNGAGKKLSEQEIEIIRDRIYDKFNHDCQIWHIIKDKRPQYIDSPKDVVNWIITLDFSFLEYDKYKQKTDVSQKVGICLHPNELISMLQFWVPRTEKFEKAILGNFRMPFLFKEVESDSEKISIEILSSLSQFEGHQSFSKELVAEILTNRALRQKIKPSNTIEENAELIKAEVLKKLEEVQKALALEKTTSGNLESELVQVSSKLEQMNTKLELISKKYIEETESIIKQKQKENLKAIEDKRNQISDKIESIKTRLGDLEEMRRSGEKEISQKLNNFSGKINSLIRKPDSYKKKLEQEILPKYFDNSKFLKLQEEKRLLEKELDSIELFSIQDKVIIFCENQNSEVLDKLGFNNVKFLPEKNSNGVFTKIRSNPDKFGLRDRDYLIDSEIEKLQKQYSNYFILNYYCFENYLYHPNNLAELNLKDFNLLEYQSEIIKQKNLNRDKIISICKKARDSYEEFRIDSEKMKSKNDEQIFEYLKSDEIEIFFKAFSMKDFFDKKSIEKFNLTKEVLSSTNWFRGEFSKIIKMN